jgi:hypothetical protein
LEQKKIGLLKFSPKLERTECMSKLLVSLKSVVVAVALSLPLVACASQAELPSAVSAGGGSGGSPLAGSPVFSIDSAAAARHSTPSEVSAAHEPSSRYEIRVHDVCRQCSR